MKHFLTKDCFLHMFIGFVGTYGLIWLSWWAYPPYSMLAHSVLWSLFVIAIGFFRESLQGLNDKTNPGAWSLHRWAEALMWIPGAIIGVVLWVFI